MGSKHHRYGDRPLPRPDYSEAYEPPERERRTPSVRGSADRQPWLPGHSATPYKRLQRQEAGTHERRHR
jgi:hypothetical protein